MLALDPRSKRREPPEGRDPSISSLGAPKLGRAKGKEPRSSNWPPISRPCQSFASLSVVYNGYDSPEVVNMEI